MATDPKANPDVLRVDEATRDAIIEALERMRYEIRREATKLLWDKRSMLPEHSDEIVDDVLTVAFGLIARESRFPVSAEPSPKRYANVENGGDEQHKSAITSSEPSPNALREALAAERAEAKEVYGIIYAQLTEGVVDDHDRIVRATNEVAEACRRVEAREALTTDQPQSDRTSDEATPAEPVYEWRAVVLRSGGTTYRSAGQSEASARSFAGRLAADIPHAEAVFVQRRVVPGPWERVDDGG